MFDDDTNEAAAREFNPEAMLWAFVITFAGGGILVWLFA